MTLFESLANELLFDLFEFLDTAYLIRAFFGLNSRFNHLLHIHFQAHQFNFQSISKENFDIICQQHLPLLVDKIISLRLSNEETPNLTELFLSQGFTLERFLRLQSLSLHYIYSLDILAKIIFQCRYLPHLTHLKIIDYNFDEGQRRIVGLFDNIWNIPNLIHCNLNGIRTKFTSLSEISSISPCIKYLSIKNIECNLQCLSNLFRCTPRLQRFCATIRSYSANERLVFAVPSIISLELSFEGFLDSMRNMFEKMPNLYHLTIETSKIYLNGNEWEQIIINYLPKIKVFQLKMTFGFSFDANREEQVDQILNTFRTAFWLEKHQWFVRCHWNSSDPTKLVTLYTLPYTFNTIHYSNECCSISTCLDEGEYRSYDRVQSVYQNRISKIDSFDNLNLFDTRFPNIRHLIVNIPFDNNILRCFPSLHSLTSLEVFLWANFGYYQLQGLLDQTPHLYSLKLMSCNRLHTALFQLTSKSIHRLDLRESSSNSSDYFTAEDCNSLIDSPLGLQCEVLLIRIKDRTSVLDLIKRMSNLRLLIFECKADTKLFQNSSSTNDEPVQWLKDHFSSTYSIIRDRRDPSYIQVWINRQIRISTRYMLILKYRYKVFRLLASKFPVLFKKT